MQIENWYLSKDEILQSSLLALRQIILSQDELVWETIKYGAPCFMYKKRMFSYLMVEKTSGLPYVLMVEGNKIEHPKLEQGDRKRMKIYKVDPNADIDVIELNGILQKALDLYRHGIVKS